MLKIKYSLYKLTNLKCNYIEQILTLNIPYGLKSLYLLKQNKVGWLVFS